MLLRKFAVSIAMLAAFAGAPVSAETPGVSESEIKIGATFPFSGPASPLSNTGKGLIAYVHSINDRGGINGRKINLVTYDDAYSPPKAVEQTRKLIESDEVAFLFGPLGTPGIGATIKYVNAKKVPHLFVVSGVTKFANFNEFPQTTTGLPSYSTEGKIYAEIHRADRARCEDRDPLPERRSRPRFRRGVQGHVEGGFRQEGGDLAL